jgi:hypothetical protein
MWEFRIFSRRPMPFAMNLAHILKDGADVKIDDYPILETSDDKVKE